MKYWAYFNLFLNQILISVNSHNILSLLVNFLRFYYQTGRTQCQDIAAHKMYVIRHIVLN